MKFRVRGTYVFGDAEYSYHDIASSCQELRHGSSSHIQDTNTDKVTPCKGKGDGVTNLGQSVLRGGRITS